MRRPIIYRNPPFRDEQSFVSSAFLIPEENEVMAPFSFSNLFKKKDSSTTETSKTSSSTDKSSSGNGSGLLNGLLGVIGVAGALAPVLPSLGVGSKSRIAETNATAAANASVYDAQTKATLATIEAEKSQSKEIDKMIFIVIAGIILITLFIMAARKKL